MDLQEQERRVLASVRLQAAARGARARHDVRQRRHVLLCCRALAVECAVRLQAGFRGHRARAAARALRAAAINRLADRTAAALARQVDVAKLDRTLMRIREIALKELCTHSEADVQLQASFMLKNSRLEPIYEDT